MCLMSESWQPRMIFSPILTNLRRKLAVLFSCLLLVEHTECQASDRPRFFLIRRLSTSNAFDLGPSLNVEGRKAFVIA